eukprot:CAMPEP_0174254838 /NCGR_PEP_ID=MMETSP0439-20130205/4165_1 /TAXON_ID=0 /ORGANISM="Stereomyxa ramosa, Strain Chinc5" /LENGTH=1441 /DNA_ID=CAMNT_0015336693 /DNA_START=72 /DNA_END=4397 /DNA_ORIENTATION=-
MRRWLRNSSVTQSLLKNSFPARNRVTISSFAHKQSNYKYAQSKAFSSSSFPQAPTKRSIEIFNPGSQTTIQDYPGRVGLWRVGVPPSGPMDNFAFRLGNALVGNSPSAAGLEFAFVGPTLKFNQKTTIALTGAEMVAELDGVQVEWWKAIEIEAGSTLAISSLKEGAPGIRTYLAFSGGLHAPDYLGSKSTFPSGNLGGTKGRPLAQGDVLYLEDKVGKAALTELPPEYIPAYSTQWEISVLPGPQAAPEYLTLQGYDTFFTKPWRVSNLASRLGVRLEGGHKPEWARTDGGEGGTHPSNLHDNGYPIGGINFSGDHPIILGPDGPSLGGFVCPSTIPQGELWKVGQLKPGDLVTFKKSSWKEATATNERIQALLDKISGCSTKKTSVTAAPYIKGEIKLPKNIGNESLIENIAPSSSSPGAQYRLSGDNFVLIEYGEPVLDLNLRARIHTLETALRSQKITGLVDTIPGVRSLLVQYDNSTLPLSELMKILLYTEESLEVPSKFKSRVVNLPLAFKERWTAQAIKRYMREVRSEATYLPDNVEFIRRINGLNSIDDVRNIVTSAEYMVLGLGDVYLGAPCAVPVDPRKRLTVPKYNPARSFTPEGAVGIGGTYMCIYPMGSPGGYQLVGRTLPIWNTNGDLPNFSPEKPWLLDMFDRVKFHEVEEKELEHQRECFKKGEVKVDIQEEEFDFVKYNEFVSSISGEVDAFKEKRAKFVAEEIAKENAITAKMEEQNNKKVRIATYLADLAVNGPHHGGSGPEPSTIQPIIPKPTHGVPAGKANSQEKPPRGLKQVFDEEGPEAFAKAVRNHKGLLLTDTTWRDAHQSLLATRVRTKDLLAIAPATSHVLHNAYSLECWGGATFDVALRFLHECPWERLSRLREAVPNIPFQMLLRGANAVGYTSYPDNVVYDFCKKAKDTGMDVFRIFDSLNYMENMRLGIDAVGTAGGIVEAAICYTGDVSSPHETKYTLDYYMNMAKELVAAGIHVLSIKDMAGLLKPKAAELLIGSLRREYPDLPIHVHCHDTANTGVATYLECAKAGADAVDCAIDAICGLTSQPAMGAVVHSLLRTPLDTGIDPVEMQHLTTYWEGARATYGPFESGQKSAGSDVYVNEIPGGQYTNLQFQASSLGMADQWSKIKDSYSQANQVLGNIIKVTPSSKVVGDLAQFMVANNLDKNSVVERADTLDFPESVIDFLQGHLGQPYGGFPEPFRSRAIKNRPRVDGRPGASMKPIDFDKVHKELEAKWGHVSELDLSSYLQYPKVFDTYRERQGKYGEVTHLPTRQFFHPMQEGEEVSFIPTVGANPITAKLVSVSKEPNVDGNHEVHFLLGNKDEVVEIKPKKDGQTPFIFQDVSKGKAAAPVAEREKAIKGLDSHVGSPMPGEVVGVLADKGTAVKKGDVLVVLSAMKMETSVTAPKDGVVKRIVSKSDMVSPGDLLVEIE